MLFLAAHTSALAHIHTCIHPYTSSFCVWYIYPGSYPRPAAHIYISPHRRAVALENYPPPPPRCFYTLAALLKSGTPPLLGALPFNIQKVMRHAPATAPLRSISVSLSLSLALFIPPLNRLLFLASEIIPPKWCCYHNTECTMSIFRRFFLLLLFSPSYCLSCGCEG